MAKMQADEAPSPSASSASPSLKRPEFVVEEYAEASLQQGKSLSQVHKELSIKVREVRQDLHDLINKRYEDFLALNTSLSGIDRTIDDVRPLLGTLTGEIKRTHEDFSAKLEYIDSRLAYRSAIREKKQMLRLFIDLSQLIDRVESILQESQLLSTASEGSSLEYIKCLERAAVDLGQIRYFVSKGSDYPFVQMAANKMQTIEETLHRALEVFLCSQIDRYLGGQHMDSGSLIACCLRTYSTLEEDGRAEEIMRNQLVRPFMLDLLVDRVSQNQLSGTCKGMGLDPKVFESIVHQILEFVRNVAVPLTNAIHSELLSPIYQHLGTRVFWQEVSASIISALPLVFVPGIPDRFHKNYLAARHLMDEFSRIFTLAAADTQANGENSGAGTKTSVLDSSCFAEFSRKWQLAAYFSICKKHVLSAILKDGGASQQSSPLKDDGAYAGTKYFSELHDDRKGGNGDEQHANAKMEKDKLDTIKRQYLLRRDWAARAVWATEYCWSSEIYLEPLGASFWHLTLQIVSWYEQMTDERISQLTAKDSSELAKNNTTGGPDTGELLDYIHDMYVLKHQLVAYAKSVIFKKLLQSTETDAVVYQRNSPNAAADQDGVATAETEAEAEAAVSGDAENLERDIVQRIEPLERTCSYALKNMGAAVVASSCSNLGSQIRRATSQFRHTNREPPTTPSLFISKLFAALRSIESQFLTTQSDNNNDVGGGGELDSSGMAGEQEFRDRTRAMLRAETCAGISQEMAKACTEALATISKTEASLQRLRKTRVYAGGSSGAASDRERSKKQQALDENALVPADVDLRGKKLSSDNDKIRRQIWLDVTEVGRIIGDHGAHAHGEYNNLVDTIAPLGPA
ncbi:hypothetical protein GGI11_000621 [Coemansia sp. RSA 2049]|nr:hypothetical protein H4217_003728 [Coemansia sp. RSA 1939]KAJ2524703.1 hypothetical protein GGI11_000621 [Coemansia sp. RSA 2049]KAJ2611287.1 hypothetical protein EV177_003554 [Coemansia sp. RSA 1804]KAJ2694148.1 hypothetical protein GGH99_000807 [Coemansia sp. RSA 1285]